jgi:hypothetical protein
MKYGQLDWPNVPKKGVMDDSKRYSIAFIQCGRKFEQEQRVCVCMTGMSAYFAEAWSHFLGFGPISLASTATGSQIGDDSK